jgi:hypothetical protein
VLKSVEISDQADSSTNTVFFDQSIARPRVTPRRSKPDPSRTSTFFLRTARKIRNNFPPKKGIFSVAPISGSDYDRILVHPGKNLSRFPHPVFDGRNQPPKETSTENVKKGHAK